MKTRYLKQTCPLCGDHLEFPAEIEGTQSECPQCRKEIQLTRNPSGIMKWPTACRWIAIALIGWFFLDCPVVFALLMYALIYKLLVDPDWWRIHPFKGRRKYSLKEVFLGIGS